MLRLPLLFAMTMQTLCCNAGNESPEQFIADGYTLSERIELDHGRTLLITRRERAKSTDTPIELVLLHFSDGNNRVEGRVPLKEGEVRCEQEDSCTFTIVHRSKDNVISTLTFTCDDASPCTLVGYSQDYIMQREPELWDGHLYHTPTGIPFGEITPHLLERIADGTTAEPNSTH